MRAFLRLTLSYVGLLLLTACSLTRSPVITAPASTNIPCVTGLCSGITFVLPTEVTQSVNVPPATAPAPAPSTGGYYPPGTPPVTVSAGPTAMDNLYPVMYGTSRQPIFDPNGRLTGYSAARDDVLHYGRVMVLIPKSHMTGSLGSPLYPLARSDGPLLKVGPYEPVMDEDAFLALAQTQMPQVTSPDTGYVLVFLHGFNNTFEDVAKRAAQIGADLGVPPNDMFLFSWASMNSIPTYPIDEATIDASEVFLKQFLGTVIKAAHGRTIHIIAHSMGNRAMLCAMM
jgi:esterase/lipase superfamily enzyme